MARQPYPAPSALLRKGTQLSASEVEDSHSAEALQYWREKLQNSRPAEIPLDRARPSFLTGATQRHHVDLDQDLHRRLEGYCSETQTNTDSVLLTAFRAAQYRLTGSSDATIAVRTAYASSKATQQLREQLWCLRTSIDDETSLEGLVQQIRNETKDALTHHLVDLEEITHDMGDNRDIPARILFSYHQDKHDQAPSPQNIPATSMFFSEEKTFDLELHCYASDTTIRLEAIYSQELFHHETITNMLSILSKTLEAALAAPHQPISSLNLSSELDHQQLNKMGLIHPIQTPYPRDSTIIHIFQQVVSSSPDTPAVKDASEQLTYHELDQRSDRIASWLRHQRDGKLVAVYADRSCETVAAFLGILKAGMAYLPLDTRSPPARLEVVLACMSTEGVVLVGKGMTPPKVKTPGIKFRQICTLEEDATETCSRAVSAEDAAYVMFTSGSTGIPKGVIIPHRGVVRLVKKSNVMEYAPTRPTMAHISSPAFDASTLEIYGPLLNGGTVVCIDQMMALDPDAMIRVFEREGVDTAWFTSALFKQHARECPRLFERLGAVYVGGDRVDPADVSAARKVMSGNIVNGYGPTENTTFSTIYCVDSSDELDSIPIGCAVSNSGAYVVDKELRLVPLGVVGELLLTGDGLALGYTDPAQDKGRFVRVQIGEKKDIRAYRTGDLARYRPFDGQLEFLGRSDNQVKIRGNRVELGEIESLLQSHELVREAIALVDRTESDSDPELAGFICLHDGDDPAIESSGGNTEEHVDMWEDAFDTDIYKTINELEASKKIGRDFVGWTSMYDGSLIDEGEMNEWLDDTIEAIVRSGWSGNVVEIGTGTGMILFNLPDIMSYIGFEPSSKAVDLVSRAAASIPRLDKKVQMHKGTALDITRVKGEIKPGSTVVINSVAQYFPSQGYLLSFIEAVLSLPEVSTVFFGDMRSYALHEQFLVRKALHLLGDGATKEAVSRMVAEMAENELEFLVDPGFFTSLVERFPGVQHVEILPKRMRATNELSSYRYGAVLHLDRVGGESTVHNVPADAWVDFTSQGLQLDSLRMYLERNMEQSMVAIGNIPCRKTILEREIVLSIEESDESHSDWLYSLTQAAQARPSLSPTELTDLAQSLGCDVEISWARQCSQKGGFDAIFHRHPTPPNGQRNLFAFLSDHQGRCSQTLTSHPWRQQRKQKARTDLMERMRSRLPSYMVPRTLHVLEKMPVNENGKIDRRALLQYQKQHRQAPQSDHSFKPPVTEKEKTIQRLWGLVLNTDPSGIGLDHTFFQHGGTSITAMRLVGAARKVGLALSVAAIFQDPSLAGMARSAVAIVNSESEALTVLPFSLLPEDVDQPELLNDISQRYDIPIDTVKDVYPCTPMQEGLFFLTSRRPGDYISQATMPITHETSIDKIKDAWESLVQATPLLRTRIVQHGLGLLQVVVDETIQWAESDSLEGYLESDRQRSVDFGKPLSRLALITGQGGRAEWLVWTIQHAAFDGWSMSLMIDAVNSISEGKAVPKNPSFSSFVQYALTQNQDPASSDYWKEYLDCQDSFAPFPVLPPSITEPKTDTVLEHHISSVSTQNLDVTVPSVVRAAWALLIGQLNNSPDVVFGATLSGRNAPIDEIEKMVGPTFTTVPVRIKVDAQQSVRAYLQDIHAQAARMIPFEQMGLNKIAKLSPSCKQACDFQTIIVVQSQDKLPAKTAPGRTFGFNNPDQETWFNPYALMLEVFTQAGSDELTVKASFDSRIIQAHVVQSLLVRLGSVLQQLCSREIQQQKVGYVSLLSEQDLQQIWTWNRKVRPAANQLLHNLFSEQVSAQPDATAICAWDGEITYRQLDDLSTAVAHKLIQEGIKPDILVPLCFEKSMWTPVAMFGVLKAGGAFVLLETSLPEARLQTIVSQLETDVILCSQEKSALGARLNKTVIIVTSDTIKPLSGDKSSLVDASRNQSPDTAAFAVFTSGSTGIPKGVVLTHSQYSSLLKYQLDALGYRPDSRVFDFASFAFDVAAHNAIASLTVGACLCIPSEHDRKNNLAGVMASMEVTLVNMTASVARLIGPETVPSLRNLILAGEAVGVDDARRWHGSPVRLVNGYGPAECPLSNINCRISKPEDITNIGTGHGVATWVVDPIDHDVLLPPGYVGELLLEGPLLCRGYLNNSSQTEKAFIHDPKWLVRGCLGHPGRRGRLYKTGDLVRYTEDGAMTFMGRKDAQVKIRGQRVELGDVEHYILKSMPGVSQVVAEVITPSEGTRPLLSAFFLEADQPAEIGASPESADSQELKAFDIPSNLRQKILQHLPRYMLPDVFFTLPSFPQTMTGKIDRKQLRHAAGALTAAQMLVSASYSETKEQPETVSGQQMQQIWSTVLQIKDPRQVGLDDSFFTLGGNSIDAMKVAGEASRLRLAFSVADIFRFPVLRDLLRSSSGTSSPTMRTAIPRRRDLSGYAVEQSFAQQRMWFLEQLHPGLSWYHMSFAARMRGPLNVGALRMALEALESRHEVLRTMFFSDDGGVSMQQVQPAGSLDLRVVDLSGNSDSLMKALGVDQSKPFKLDKEHGWRVSLYQMGPGHYVLSLVMHHIVADGWSMDVMQKELATLYASALRTEQPALLSQMGDLPVQYQDYAIWERSKQHGEDYQHQLEYWLQRLDGSRPAEFLCDKPRPARLSGKAGSEPFLIDGDLYNDLQSLSHSLDVTPFAILLSAFHAAHYRLTAVEDAVIGSANANRNQWELKNLIGFFVNMQCIRTRVEGSSTFGQLVMQVHETLSESFASQDVPFENIVAKLQKENRDLSRSPLAQVAFALHSQRGLGEFHLEGVESEALGVEITTRFDMEMHLYQEEESLRGELIYSEDLFEVASVRAVISTFLKVLRSGLSDTGSEMSLLPLWEEEDHDALQHLGVVQEPKTEYPRHLSIADVFQQQVLLYPGDLCVRDTETDMTYAQVDTASGIVADWLQSQALPEEHLVAILATRSCENIVAMIGILKAGLTYVPLDKDAPPGRLDKILGSIPDRRLVLLGKNGATSSLGESAEVIKISDLLHDRLPKANTGLTNGHSPPRLPGPRSLAYVMYTSGSTGQPKGVMIEHRSVVRLVKETRGMHFDPRAAPVAHMANLAFDASMWEIFSVILNGGALICIEKTAVLESIQLRSIFRRENVGTVILTPALLEQHLTACPNVFSGVSTVYVCGDTFQPKTLQMARKIIPQARLCNGYGPTENCGASTSYVIPATDPCTNGVPVGEPVSNSGVIILDDQQRLVPIGVLGELVVTGDGLARGYTDPEATRRSFTQIYLTGRKVRAYKTGDLARYRPSDGQLELFGRKDRQVKVRGNRIELAEIEHVLRTHTQVGGAAVVLTGNSSQDSQIAGFVTLEEVQADSSDSGVEVDSPEDEEDDEGKQVQEWQQLFDSETYLEINSSEIIDTGRLGRDFSGWVSMYNGDKIPVPEMDEWLDDAISTILNSSTGSGLDVLEVGPGTGMILFNLAKHINSYVGIDTSKKAIDFLQRSLSSMPDLESKVKLYNGSATDLNLCKDAISPSLVILNSVVQYFPSQQYLLQVIESLLQLTSVKTIFLGDVRTFALHREFQLSKAVARLGANASLDTLREEMDRIAEAETELLVDPGFFTALKDTEHRLSSLIEHVEILPKRMTATNELSSYRYACVIHVRRGVSSDPWKIEDDGWVDFTKSLDANSLKDLLLEERKLKVTNPHESASPVVAISNIPHSKTIKQSHVVTAIGKGDESIHIENQFGWMNLLERAADKCSSLSATALVEIASQTGYRVEISWARQHSQKGNMDAIFHDLQPSGNRNGKVLFTFPADHHSRSQHTLTNHPLLQKRKQRVTAQLDKILKAQLPSYMVPQSISVLERLPVNANGKLDRRLLAKKAEAGHARIGNIDRPRRQPVTQTQRLMRTAWADVLDRDEVTIGLDDNFFLLGGNSITAMKLVSRVRAGMQKPHVAVADVFRYPTLEQLAGRVDGQEQSDETASDVLQPFSLVPETLDITSLARSIAKKCRVEPAKIQDVYPCTPLQEGLLGLSTKRPGDYMVQEVIAIPLHVSLARFQEAWKVALKSLSILRTRIVRHNLGILQVVVDEQIEWVESDNLDEYLRRDRERSMGLGDRLCRFGLVDDHFVWTLHHAVYDGWSFPLMVDVFHQAYYGRLRAKSPNYSGFIKYVTSQSKQDVSKYWKTQLDWCESVPFPVVPPSIQPLSDKTVRHSFRYGQGSTTGVTAAIMLRAAWAIVSSQMNSSRESTFGVTVSGRNAPVPRVDEIIGPTFATVPVRIQWDREMKVLDYLGMVQKQATDMIPFEQTGLQNISLLSPGCRQACDFQTLLVIHAAHQTQSEEDKIIDVSKTYQQQQQWFNPFALMLEVQLGHGSIDVDASFDSRVISEDTLTLLLERLFSVMQQFCNPPSGQTLGDIQTVSAADLTRIWEWNKTFPAPIDQCVHGVISERASETPDALAIDAWDGQLTYAQLDQLSDTVARCLAKCSNSDKLIPLCFEKSLWTSVALLGVLKAGRAFTLLDTSLPESRLETIVRQTNSTLILSSKTNEILASRLCPKTIVIDSMLVGHASKTSGVLPQIAPSDLLCTVFTSGSTGIPKGAMLSHSNFASGLHHQRNLLGFTKQSRIFDFASYAFDIAIHNALATFMTGGCLCVPSDDQRKGQLVETMAAMRTTIADLTPSVARLVDPEMVPDLNVLILAGEAVSTADTERWCGRTPRITVCNSYGPAECGISTINCDDSAERLVYIGKGAGVVTWVVDPEDHNTLVGLGCPGELLLEGPLVGLGYLSEPEKTRQVFIGAPLWLTLRRPERQDSRLYKTGDLVRYDPDGRMEFLGRKDNQVKIRGQRVELGEIEHRVLECLPDSKQVVCEAVSADNKNPLIVAFVRSRTQTTQSEPMKLLAVEAAEKGLRRHLPSYMVPSVFIAVKEFPLTATRKTDRAKLRQLGQDFLASTNGQTTDARQSQLENLIYPDEQPAYDLARTIEAMSRLRVEEGDEKTQPKGYSDLTLHDHGLDSINMMSLKYYIQQRFDVSVSMQFLVDRDTSIRSLAAQVIVEKKQATGERLLNGNKTATKPSLDLAAEIEKQDQLIESLTKHLLKSYPHQNGKTHRSGVTVLLTGANGFIGTQILRQLLSHTQIREVIALVRGKDDRDSHNRTILAATKAQWWREDFPARLTVWEGDLSKEHLGLGSERWNTLSSAVDIIIHNGAVVHWGKTYADMEAPNVSSTARLISLVESRPHMKMVYVTGGQPTVFEDGQETNMAKELSSDGTIGYAQTKFVAEALVRRGAALSLSFKVVRPGLVVGTQTEGVANADDYLWRLAAACTQAGAYDREAANTWFDVSDVGTVASTIVDAALGSVASMENAKHVVPVKGRLRWGHFWEALTQMGYKLEARRSSEWTAIMKKALEEQREKHPLWPVAHMVVGNGPKLDDQSDENGYEQPDELEVDDDILAVQEAVMKSAEFLRRTGFLPLEGDEVKKGDAFTRSGL